MGQSIVQVDAFTDRPFAGNPAAVCVLPGPRDASWMQNVAREMNLSETAFLHREAEGFRLRWFTPAVEVDLCGHATLASAHVLWEQGHLSPEAPARFQTRSGLLFARREGGWIELDFPVLGDFVARDPPARGKTLGLPAAPGRALVVEQRAPGVRRSPVLRRCAGDEEQCDPYRPSLHFDLPVQVPRATAGTRSKVILRLVSTDLILPAANIGRTRRGPHPLRAAGLRVRSTPLTTTIQTSSRAGETKRANSPSGDQKP